ncbi:MAG: 23S rRNA (guanosine(2251)-2'-O)-methyltransferase RlmB [Bacteroidetes bacterium]|nr:23S rRNA (guanosine(2251)-2'-O)-methyltransferase RlmB [Bacteroidota bacterium]MDA0950336.1 23S rRNA (guanosine(2251)-2'-O)-methyltransferase RlmB [Bacteroidota bacterium]
MSQPSIPFIYGIRTILEALEADQDIQKAYLLKGGASPLFKDLEQSLRKAKVPISYVPTERLQRFTQANHQGAVAEIAPIPFADFEESVERIIANAKIAPLILLLDGLTDVRNFGAVLRTAESSGVDLVVLPQQGMAPLNKDAIKTSQGAAFSIPMAKVSHIKDAVRYLQSSGIKVFAASEKSETSLYESNLTEGIGIILGSEERGINPSVLKLVDHSICLPQRGQIASLNVSVACGVILYEVLRQRKLY